MKTHLPRKRPLSGTEDRRRLTALRRGALLATLYAGASALGAAPALADPAAPDPVADVPPAPPAVVSVPPAPPATGKSADGWTLIASANSETLTAAVPLDPALATRDYVASGVFNGTLRGPRQRTASTSGTFEVGYQIQCIPAGMLAALKPAVTQVQVLREDFNGANPSATVTAFHLQVDCMGPASIRSYAILTRTTGGDASVVAYYGVPVPA